MSNLSVQNPPITSTSLSSSRVPCLDGLRGLAVLLVLFVHYVHDCMHSRPTIGIVQLLHNLSGLCWTGVDLFFVLSGFLIGGILMDQCRSKNFFSVFYARRFFRIMPVYWLLCLPILILLACNPGPRQIPLWSYLCFQQNWFMAYHSTFGKDTQLYLGPTWSLAIEEQFYLLFPLVVYIFRKDLSKLRNIMLILLVTAPMVRTVLFASGWTKCCYLLLPCRMDALMVGALAAFLMRHHQGSLIEQKRPLLMIAVALLGATFLGFACFDLTSAYSPIMATIGYTVVAIFYGMGLLLAVSTNEGKSVPLICSNILIQLGRISYATYLFHFAVMLILFSTIFHSIPTVDSIPGALLAFFACWITLTMAAISWRFFESPILKFAQKFAYIQENPVSKKPWSESKSKLLALP